MCWFTKSQIACTLDQPGIIPSKRFQAVADKRSVSQYRLGSKNTSVSSGRDSTLCSNAYGKESSGTPLSRISASAVTVNLPGGATARVHQLPKPSRYIESGTEGVVIMVSGLTKSEV